MSWHFLFKSLLPRKIQIQADKIETYLENAQLLKLTNEQILSCEGIISEDEEENNKSPWNDGLSNKLGWNQKAVLVSIDKTFLNQELATSQKQAVIRMLGKKRPGHRYHCLIQT